MDESSDLSIDIIEVSDRIKGIFTGKLLAWHWDDVNDRRVIDEEFNNTYMPVISGGFDVDWYATETDM